MIYNVVPPPPPLSPYLCAAQIPSPTQLFSFLLRGSWRGGGPFRATTVRLSRADTITIDSFMLPKDFKDRCHGLWIDEDGRCWQAADRRDTTTPCYCLITTRWSDRDGREA